MPNQLVQCQYNIKFFRFLLVGTNFSAQQYEFNVGRSTISSIVRETCQALWTVLQPLEMPEPTLEQWIDISNKFYLLH